MCAYSRARVCVQIDKTRNMFVHTGNDTFIIKANNITDEINIERKMFHILAQIIIDAYIAYNH